VQRECRRAQVIVQRTDANLGYRAFLTHRSGLPLPFSRTWREGEALRRLCVSGSQGVRPSRRKFAPDQIYGPTSNTVPHPWKPQLVPVPPSEVVP
jgi:hypothetical protein